MVVLVPPEANWTRTVTVPLVLKLSEMCSRQRPVLAKVTVAELKPLLAAGVDACEAGAAGAACLAASA